MIILLLLGFNGLLLYFVLNLVLSCFWTPTPYHATLWAVLAGAIVVGLALLFYTRVGQWLLRLIAGARWAIERERKQLMPILRTVQTAIQERCGLPPLDLYVMIIDDPVPNAAAIGKDTVVLSRGLYETANPHELAGVIAHELGHLHRGDSQKLGIALGVSTISLVIAAIAGFCYAIASAFGRNTAGGEAGLVMTLMGWLVALLAGFFLLFMLLGNGMLKLALLFQGRRQEYQADQLAIQAGFGPGLLSYLDKIKDFTPEGKRSFLTRLYDTHPPTMLRIGEIEKVLAEGA